MTIYCDAEVPPPLPRHLQLKEESTSFTWNELRARTVSSSPGLSSAPFLCGGGKWGCRAPGTSPSVLQPGLRSGNGTRAPCFNPVFLR